MTPLNFNTQDYNNKTEAREAIQKGVSQGHIYTAIDSQKTPEAEKTTRQRGKCRAQQPPISEMHRKQTGYKIIDKSVSIEASMIQDEEPSTIEVTKTKTDVTGKVHIPKRYIRDEKLSKGAAGEVVSMKSESGTSEKVLKRAHDEHLSMKQAQSLLKQGIAVLGKIHCHPETGEPLRSVPGIIRQYKAYRKDVGVIMTRYAGDVDGPERRPKNLDEGKELVCQTAFGLAHLHRTSKKKECYIAGDIKPKNILTRMKNGKREYVLADLDDAHVVGKKAHISTPLYVCPADKAIKSMLDTAIKSAQSKKEKAALEQERGKLEQAADVYALGLSFRSIFTGEDPSEFLTAGKVSNKLGRTNPVPFEKLSDQSSSSDASEIKDYRIIYALIDQMTDEDWKLRPTGDMILQMLSDADFPVPDYGTTKR